MIVPVTHISPLITIRRSRLLPEKGQVFVRARQKVTATDVIGEVLLPGPIGRIPEHCFYLGTAHVDGLDSRYADIGFVCRARIIGTGDAIL